MLFFLKYLKKIFAINNYQNVLSKVKLAFIPQEDYLLDRLKVRESLVYSSKLKNKGHVDHELVVDMTLDKLGIKECADICPNNCSEGQKKRISIALILVSKPNILIIDEPTSNLDAVTTWRLICTLIEITKQIEPIAVVITIHQPSAKLFNLFNAVYIMSYDGQCIYEGSPQQISCFFNQNGLQCPQYYNAADFAIEIALKEHGIDKIIMLSNIMRIKNLESNKFENPLDFKRENRTFYDIWILSLR